MIKTKTIIFLLILFPSFLFGQQTKKIIDRKRGAIAGFYEEYYVLKTDKSIKHGSYKRFNYKRASFINGYFKNGAKDSIWEFYSYQGDLQQKYDFTKNELIFSNIDPRFKNKEINVIRGSDTTLAILDRIPIYIGADAMMHEHMQLSLVYPQEAKESGISGTVAVLFTIDKEGKTRNHSIIIGIGPGCDEAALKCVKEIPDNWLAGILNGQAVDVLMVLPVTFTLNMDNINNR